jgi:MFS family permease
VGGIVLALANFVAVLNMTIANVTVPNIAGALGAGSSQGTWVITSYAVAEAITVPLTGWLAGRFGAVRLFCVSVVLFGVFSLLCGMSTSLGMLLGMRVLQGMAGGPLLALSQTLLLRIFPKEQSMQAMGLWAMTTLLAPVVGPVLGGWLCDNYSWPWVFLINVPMALLFGLIAWILLERYRDPTVIKPVDKIGMILLVIWVAALQIMLDEGKDKDWFSSLEIRVLAITAAVGFVSFLIWELTEKNPIVDLRVFRHRGFSSCMLVLALAFGAFFGLNVLTPQWLQFNMGYTTTWAGRVGRTPVGRLLPDRGQARQPGRSAGAHLHRLSVARHGHALARLRYRRHELLGDLHPALLHGSRHADVLRPPDGARHGVGQRRGDGVRRRTHEFRAHDLRCHSDLPCHHVLAEPQHHRPRRTGQCRRSHRPGRRNAARRNDRSVRARDAQ